MFNIFLVLFISAELCFYLLIAQTGIVEVLHSDIMQVVYLPLGGVLGTYIASHTNFKNEIKVLFFLFLQMTMTLFYPHLNPLMLFILGLGVGGLSPLIVSVLQRATAGELAAALGTSYLIGTLLFPSDPSSREFIGLLFTLTALASYLLIGMQKSIKHKETKAPLFALFLMASWVFFDSSLFETLSRDPAMDIWRNGYTLQIITFHIAGVLFGILYKARKEFKEFLVAILFTVSYLLYIDGNALALSMVYPFVISFYNVLILQSLVQLKSLRTIGISMIVIGWGASGSGLFVALYGLASYMPILLLGVVIYSLVHFHFFKEFSYV
jgi:hypothetical protein